MLFYISGSYFGTVISLPISGALAESSAGWPSIFYVFGKISTAKLFLIGVLFNCNVVLAR